MTLGEKIKQIRNSAGMTRVEFSKRLGCCCDTVKNYENGKTLPSEDYLKAIANDYDQDFQMLIGLRNEMDDQIERAGNTKELTGYDHEYHVSDIGEVFRMAYITRDGKYCKSKVVTPIRLKSGYFYVNLRRGGKTKLEYVHRLVARLFIQNNGGKPEVNHIDGDKGNNVASNLEWVTTKENAHHALWLGLTPSGEASKNSKLKGEEVIKIFESSKVNRVLAAEYGVSQSQIGRIKNGVNWKFFLKGE